MKNDFETYEILIDGEIALDWSGWFDNLTISHPKQGLTLLTGALPDQAALHGLLAKIRDLNLDLISVRKR